MRSTCRRGLAPSLLALLVPFAVLAPGTPSPPATSDVAPFDTFSDVAVPASDGATLTADVYVPDGAGPSPAVLLLHGGAWTGGDKSDLAAVAASLTQLGWVAVSLNYRLGVALVDRQARDVVDALAWMEDHATEYRIDPDRIALLGASAGGHLAAQAATKGTGESPRPVGVVEWSGIYDLSALAPRDGAPPTDCNAECRETFGSGILTGVIGCSVEVCPETYADLSPVMHVDGATPPMLLTGSYEDAVPRQQVVEMSAAMDAAGVANEPVIVDGAAHGYELGAEVWQDTTAFLDRRFSADTPDVSSGGGSAGINAGLVAVVAVAALGLGTLVWWWRMRARA